MNKKLTYLLISLLIIGISSYLASRKTHTPNSNTTNQQTVNGSSSVIGQRTKTSACIVNGPLQDTACSPGAVFSNVSKDQICVSGYSKSVRNVPSSEKDAVYSEYGIASHTSGQYEVDHLISLELGGSNDIANLWPEAANPIPGFHQKDAVENYLHDQVCSGNLSLVTAQQEISTNWISVYNQIPH